MELRNVTHLIGGVKASPGAVRLRHVHDTHLTPAGLQQRRPPVVVMRQHLQEMLRPLQQAVVNVEGIPGPQLQVQLQHDGLGVLGVQQPGAPQLGHGVPVGVEEVRRGKGAVEVPQSLAAGGVRTAQLVAPVSAVSVAVAA